jgi:hypothetical protein
MSPKPKPAHKPSTSTSQSQPGDAPDTQSAADDGPGADQYDDDEFDEEPTWRRMAHNVFRPPRVLHDWVYDLREVEVRAGWTELFYDLLFVVTCIVLGDALKESM